MECAAILRRGWHYGRGFKRRNPRRPFEKGAGLIVNKINSVGMSGRDIRFSRPLVFSTRPTRLLAELP
jgi:hypothetical protein